MKRAVLAVLIALSAAPVRAAEMPKEVAKPYAGLLAAIRKLDQKAFATYFAKDYTIVDPKGKSSDRAAYLKDISGFLGGGKSASATLKCTGSTTKGDTIDVEFDFVVTVHGKPGGDIQGHEVGTDSWKKVGGKWLLVKTVDKSFDVKPVGGKPKKPAKAK